MVDGGSGANALVVNEVNRTTGDTVYVSATGITGTGAPGFAIGYTATGGTFGNGVNVYRRRADGTWSVARDIWASSSSTATA